MILGQGEAVLAGKEQLPGLGPEFSQALTSGHLWLPEAELALVPLPGHLLQGLAEGCMVVLVMTSFWSFPRRRATFPPSLPVFDLCNLSAESFVGSSLELVS